MDCEDHWFQVVSFTGLGGFLDSCGIAPADLLRRSGISPRQFADRDGCIPRDNALRLLNEIVRIADDPLAPLRFASRQDWSHFGACGSAVLQAPTVRDGAATFARAIQLVQSGTRVVLDTMGPRTRLSFTSTGVSSEDPASNNLRGALWLYRTVGLSGEPYPVEVRLARANSRRTADYEGYLGPNLVFGCDRTEILFDRGLLELPIFPDRTDNAGGPRNWLASDLMEGPHAVHPVVADALPRTRPTVEWVAARFRTSSRTLQRVLERWGLSFKELVEDTRRIRALELIENPHIPMVEVAFLTGYSDQANFTRAFYRWTGMSPRAYRNRPWAWPDSAAVRDETGAASPTL